MKTLETKTSNWNCSSRRARSTVLKAYKVFFFFLINWPCIKITESNVVYIFSVILARIKNRVAWTKFVTVYNTRFNPSFKKSSCDVCLNCISCTNRWNFKILISPIFIEFAPSFAITSATPCCSLKQWYTLMNVGLQRCWYSYFSFS